MGRRKSSKPLKRPSDYPLFSFRSTDSDIERINRIATKIQKLRNNNKPEDAPFIYLADIYVEALEIGLEKLMHRKHT